MAQRPPRERGVAVKQCANATCSAQAARKYCSRLCQNTARTRTHQRQLPDVWVDMDLYRLLVDRAHLLGVRVSDLVLNLIESEVDYTPYADLVDLSHHRPS